jgi:hypothetical protein
MSKSLVHIEARVRQKEKGTFRLTMTPSSTLVWPIAAMTTASPAPAA